MRKSLLHCLFFLSGSLFAQQKTNTPTLLFIGTYTNTGKSEGMYTYSFDEKTASTDFVSKTISASPSYLSISKDQKYLYAVNQLGDAKGGVSAYQLDAKNGKLSFLNSYQFGTNGPCYITTDNYGQFIFTANYNDGYVKAFPILPDGSLDSKSQLIQHVGSSTVKGRQDIPHVHSTVLSPDNKYLLVQDLGTDYIEVYPIHFSSKDAPLGKVLDSCKMPAGSGPRHLVFHPTKKDKAYVIQEISGAVTLLNFNKGKLKIEQTIQLNTEGFKGENRAADIHISPDGNFLYGSNRGEANDISIFSIDKTGHLLYVGKQSTLGKSPRNFTIDPTGNFLLVANQQSDEVVIFKRDKKTGLLADTGKRIEVGAPTFLQIIKVK